MATFGHKDLKISLDKLEMAGATVQLEEPLIIEEFISVFNLFYRKSLGRFKNGKEISLTNFTMITSYSMQRAVELYGFTVNFEVEGRHDAVIYTDDGEPFIFMEWENYGWSIFDDGGELEKLKNSATRKNLSNGGVCFLLTYIGLDEFDDFVYRLSEYWKGSDVLLYLTLVITESQEKMNVVSFTRQIIFDGSSVLFTGDF